jgi:hypothetical protein
MRKGVLTDISANAPRLRPSVARQPVKMGLTKRRLTTVDLAEIALKKRTHPPPLSLSPTTEGHEEFRLTMVNLGKKQKLGISRDAEDSPGE